MPQGVPGVNNDECQNSFKQSVKLNGDEYIKTSNYFLLGLDSLKCQTPMQKKFAKNIFELMIQYYREKKDIVKKKQKRLVTSLTHFHVRYKLKHSLYSLITSSDYNKTIKRLQEAYTELKSGQMPGGSAIQLERRENADLIAVLILKFLLNSM